LSNLQVKVSFRLGPYRNASTEPATTKTAAWSSDAAKSGNMDRLRSHLAAGSLAHKLLDAWMAGKTKDAQARMLSVLEQHGATTQVIDAGSSTSAA
jgi:hypothetical protein